MFLACSFNVCSFNFSFPDPQCDGREILNLRKHFRETSLAQAPPNPQGKFVVSTWNCVRFLHLRTWWGKQHKEKEIELLFWKIIRGREAGAGVQ